MFTIFIDNVGGTGGCRWAPIRRDPICLDEGIHKGGLKINRVEGPKDKNLSQFINFKREL